MTSMKPSNFSSGLGAPLAERGWRVEGAVRAIAGTLVLSSALLAAFVSPWWLLLTAFVGANLVQSALSGWCLMSNLLALTGLKDS